MKCWNLKVSCSLNSLNIEEVHSRCSAQFFEARGYQTNTIHWSDAVLSVWLKLIEYWVIKCIITPVISHYMKLIVSVSPPGEAYPYVNIYYIVVIYYLRRRRRLCFHFSLFVCLSVCLSVRRITEKLWTDFDEISWRSRALPRDQGDKFCWRSRSPSGSRNPKSEIRIHWIAGVRRRSVLSQYF